MLLAPLTPKLALGAILLTSGTLLHRQLQAAPPERSEQGRSQPAQAPTQAQDDVFAATNAQRKYLDRNPYHDKVFQDLCERALGKGGTGSLVEHYRERAASDGQDLAARVLLVRLLTHRGDVDAAAVAAEQLPNDRVDARLLRGDLELRLGRHSAATEHFEAALAASPGSSDQALVLRRLCEVLIDAGDDEQLEARARSLAALDEGDHVLQMEAAQLLEQGGRLARAANLYAAAAQLVPDDIPRLTQALADQGRCHQQLYQGDLALECYSRARSLLRHDHWLAVELAEQQMELHAVAGTLDQLAAELRAEAAEVEAGVSPLVALAKLERLRNQPAEAIAHLQAAIERAPGDQRVSELLIAAARESEQVNLERDELLRRVSLSPDDVALSLNLVDTLARAGDLAHARQRLERLTTETATSARWAEPLSRAWSGLGDAPRAAAILEQALAAEFSLELVLVRARLAAEHDSTGAALAILEGAEPEPPTEESLVALAKLRAEYGGSPGALRLLERAGELEPESPAAPLAAADIHIEAEEPTPARSLLREAARRSRGASRLEILGRLKRLFGSSAELQRWCQDEAEAWTANPDDPFPLLVQGQLLERSNPGVSIARYRSYLDETGLQPHLGQTLASVLERERRYDEALDVYDSLAEIDLVTRQESLLKKVSLLQRLRRSAEAELTLAELRKLAWKQPEVLARVARWYDTLRQPELAIEVLDRVRRLDRDNPTAERLLGNLLRDLGSMDRARVELESAWRRAPAKERRALAKEIYATLGNEEQSTQALAVYRDRAQASPYDRELPLLAGQLALFAKQPQLAVELTGAQLERRPRDTEALDLNARALLQTGKLDEALGTAEKLVELGANADSLVLELMPAVLHTHGENAAYALAALTVDPAAVADELIKGGYHQRAVGLLRGTVEAGGLDDPAIARALYKLHRYLRDTKLAIRVIQKVEDLDGPTVVSTHRLGLLFHADKQPEAALACAKRLQSLGASSSLVDSFVKAAELGERWEALKEK